MVGADLRGYGDSDKPEGLPDHSNYSKRVMAQDQVDVMCALGHEDFFLVGQCRHLDHERADLAADRKIECDMLALWGAHGAVEKCFRPLEEWRRLARNVRGHALPCGHYVPEEAPEQLLGELLEFLPH